MVGKTSLIDIPIPAMTPRDRIHELESGANVAGYSNRFRLMNYTNYSTKRGHMVKVY